MKKIVIIIFTLNAILTFGQTSIDQINQQIEFIESDLTLTESEFDWTELTETVTDGGGILKVWQNENQICKIVEEIGLSFGRIKTTIYLNDAGPIKIIETEENYGKTNDGMDYSKTSEVFRADIYILGVEDEKDGSYFYEIERKGKRVFSDGSCELNEYYPTIKRAVKAIEK